jgi:hypothetical protein
MAFPIQHKENITLEESPDLAMMALETAAEAKDEMAFLQAKRAIDWEERPAEDFVRAVDFALSCS